MSNRLQTHSPAFQVDSNAAAIASMAVGVMVYPCAPTAQPAAFQPWSAIYQVAYQRAKIALEPSRFQQMIKPSWN
jgi:hypothetical protein